eukprot:gene13801-biopygen5053
MEGWGSGCASTDIPSPRQGTPLHLLSQERTRLLLAVACAQRAHRRVSQTAAVSPKQLPFVPNTEVFPGRGHVV